MGCVESNGGVHTGGRQRQPQWHRHGMGWVPICDGNGNGNIYMYIATPQCEHPHWIPLDPFTNDVIAVAADTPPNVNTHDGK